MENNHVEKRDENQEGTSEKNINQDVKKLLDPEEQIRKFSKGTLKLTVPIIDGENTVTELHWDFLSLTGSEYVDALDADRKAVNTFRITNTQAFCLFAAAAAKSTKGIDSTDIRRGMGIMDAQKATQLATVFFTASNQAGYSRISNE